MNVSSVNDFVSKVRVRHASSRHRKVSKRHGISLENNRSQAINWVLYPLFAC